MGTATRKNTGLIAVGVSPDGKNVRVARCPPNVAAFLAQHYSDAKTIADKMGNNVTPAQVLATSGNESTYGTSPMATDDNNYFGIHGVGTAGSRPAKEVAKGAKKPVQIARFSNQNGFLESGLEMAKRASPYLTPDLGTNPRAFFDMLHKRLIYSENDPNYGQTMTRPARGNRGPYTIIEQCLANPDLMKTLLKR